MPAPANCEYPWSTQNAIRWVPINPLVEKPQTPKLNASSQKSSERMPRISPSIATVNGLAARGAAGGSDVVPKG